MSGMRRAQATQPTPSAAGPDSPLCCSQALAALHNTMLQALTRLPSSPSHSRSRSWRSSVSAVRPTTAACSSARASASKEGSGAPARKAVVDTFCLRRASCVRRAATSLLLLPRAATMSSMAAVHARTRDCPGAAIGVSLSLVVVLPPGVGGRTLRADRDPAAGLAQARPPAPSARCSAALGQVQTVRAAAAEGACAAGDRAGQSNRALRPGRALKRPWSDATCSAFEMRGTPVRCPTPGLPLTSRPSWHSMGAGPPKAGAAPPPLLLPLQHTRQVAARLMDYINAHALPHWDGPPCCRNCSCSLPGNAAAPPVPGAVS